MQGPGINEVVQRVLDVEKQAQEVVNQAEEQGKAVVAQAKEQAREILEQARRSATAEASQTTQEILGQAQERDARIAHEMQADASVVEISRAKVPIAAQIIAQQILGA